MQRDFQRAIKDNRVAVGKISADYPKSDGDNEMAQAIGRVAENLGWADEKSGAFGKAIWEGARVVVKPNFVLHKNQGKGGTGPLITHQSLIKSIVKEVLKANPGQVLIGDAPVQSCDFARLLQDTGLDAWSNELQNRDARYKGIRDFRRTTCVYKNGVRLAEENRRPEEDFVLYNLGADSLLEAVTDEKDSFRVTCYDPRLMAKTHSRGNHQYLVAREVIEADVIINVPKLKTHKKAGITNALKNLVGINGNKEYLPHHRIGGTSRGGDCYPGDDLVKRVYEFVADRRNITASPGKGKMLAGLSAQLERVMRLRGDRIGVEGAWSGNQTVPRMCLDLNRILLYGKSDSTLDAKVQRRVLHIVDAIVAGQAEGPLAPDPLPLGLILAGENASAVDWVAAHFLGYDARKILLLTESFEDFRWKIADFRPDEIKILGDENFSAENLLDVARKQNVTHPAGWLSAKA